MFFDFMEPKLIIAWIATYGSLTFLRGHKQSRLKNAQRHDERD